MLKYGQNAEEEVRKHEKRETRGDGRLMSSLWPAHLLLDSPCLRIVIFRYM
jgi:hypothetical protein